MGLIAVSSVLVGAWANRCNVFILVPLIAATLVTAALYGIAHGDGAGGIALDIAAAVACLEAGYVAALVAPAFAKRTPQRAASERGRLTAMTDPAPLAPVGGVPQVPLSSLPREAQQSRA